jgi:hypothetical protein
LAKSQVFTALEFKATKETHQADLTTLLTEESFPPNSRKYSTLLNNSKINKYPPKAMIF